MAEIILNPDIEIVHEEDRKLYWQFRLALDSKFLTSMKHHLKEEDHCYHTCFNQYCDVRQLALKNFVDQQSQFAGPRDILEKTLLETYDELAEAVTSILAIYKEAQRRGIKLK